MYTSTPDGAAHSDASIAHKCTRASAVVHVSTAPAPKYASSVNNIRITAENARAYLLHYHRNSSIT